MVDAINSNLYTPQFETVGTGATHYVSKTAKKAADLAEDTFSSSVKDSVKSAALFEGLPLVRFFKNQKKLLTENTLFTDLTNINKGALDNLLHGEGKVSKRVLDFVKTSNNSKKAFSDVRGITNATAKMEKLQAKAAEKGLSKEAASKLEKKIGKLNTKIKSKTIAATETLGGAAKAGSKASSKFGKLLKSSGAGIMLVFSGIAELASEVIPTFQELGTEKGLKQLGKSAIKVVADTAGFIGGEYAGTALGTAIGTAICPGIGSAVGAVVGFVGGMLGSFIAGKATKAVVGESEREIAKKELEAQKPTAEDYRVFSTTA